MSYRGIKIERRIHRAQVEAAVAWFTANKLWADNMDGDQDEAVWLYEQAHHWLTELVLLLRKKPR